MIGGGHNGLVTAGYLARAGLRVIVVEKRPMVGGACITEEPWPGFRPSWPRPSPLRISSGCFSGPEAERLLRELFLMSAKDILDEWFESEYLKAALVTQAIIGAFLGPYSPGTAYVLGHHNIGILDGHKEVWGYSKGGMGKITEAMARAAEHFGAVVRVGADVKRVLVKDGRAIGVETEAGERIEAKVVASSVDAKQTFLRLVPADAVEKEFLENVRRIRTRGAALKFNAALDGLPDYRAIPGAPKPHHSGTVNIIPSMDYAERAYDEAKYGAFSSQPFIETQYQSVVDPTVAPPGKHTMSCFVQYAPTALKGTTWDEFKPKAAETVPNTIEEYAPNIRKVVKHWQILSPVDIERTIGMTGGNIFQGDITPDQIFSFRPLPGWANYRMPVKGLYLCGSATHPGGGVLGAPGYNAARVILEDLRAGR